MTVASTDFVLLVDKPVGKTSHDVVYRVRRALGIKKVGHTGTLDPFATGLLLMCVGRATRIAEYLTGLRKRYRAVALLGTETDTEDLTGTVLSQNAGWRDLSDEQVDDALRTFLGDYDQVPPQYSAKKVGGVAMHRRARAGERVELPSKRCTIHEVSRESAALPEVAFEVECSSGTYIRSLARDLGERLGVGAHLTELRRTQVAGFHVDDAIPLEALEDPEAVSRARISPAEALCHLHVLDLDEAQVARLRLGQRIEADSGAFGAVPEGMPIVLQRGGELVAVGERMGQVIAPKKVFAP